MALPTTIANLNAAGWSDHKNQSHGGAMPLTVYADTNDNSTFYRLGDTSNYVGIIGAYTGQSGHKLVRVRLFLSRVGSPSGNLSVEVRPTLSDTVADLTVLSGVSKSLAASSIPTSKTETIFSFPVPVFLPTSDTIKVALLVTISVQGDSSNYIKVHKGTNGDRGTTHAYGAGSQVWVGETQGSSISIGKVVEISKSGAVVALISKTANDMNLYTATDNGGSSWGSSTRAITSVATKKSVNCQASIQDLSLNYFAVPHSTANLLAIYKHQSGVGFTLDPNATANFGTFGSNVTGNAPIGGGRRTNGQSVLVAQGATETVMGSARRRIKLMYFDGSVYQGPYDVQGSTNTPNSTLPADAVDYDLRWAGIDPNGDCHIVYSRSDSSTLQYRKFTSANAFATINTLNGAVGSATANYPVGQPAFYFQSPDWFIAIPYVDNTSNTLKVARCNVTTTTTSGNWVLTEIVAASAEVTASNPAVLIADNAQGGKLFCLRVIPTTRGLRLTDDSGTNTWKPEVDWRGATQQVGGISAFYIEDGIAFVYLEESTTPDEVRYDRL